MFPRPIEQTAPTTQLLYKLALPAALALGLLVWRAAQARREPAAPKP